MLFSPLKGYFFDENDYAVQSISGQYIRRYAQYCALREALAAKLLNICGIIL